MTQAAIPATVIALWGLPRSLSTAFTRMMIERRDMLVLHEPVSNILYVGHFDIEGTRVHTPRQFFDHVLEISKSLTALNPQMTLDEGGYENQFRLFEHVRAGRGFLPPVVDADDLLADPPRVVSTYCRTVGIPYLPAALTWSPRLPEALQTGHANRSSVVPGRHLSRWPDPAACFSCDLPETGREPKPASR
jgi:hypothetical protein